MKKTKFIKTFENFKVNEEVPYDYEVGNRKVNSWTPEERQDLKDLGADEIGDNTAKFIESDGLIVNIEKNIWRYNGPNSYLYKAKSNQENLPGLYNNISGSTWLNFIDDLNQFMKNKGKRKISYRHEYEPVKWIPSPPATHSDKPKKKRGGLLDRFGL